MGDGFGVHTDEMRSHAGKLEGVAQQISTAGDAAGQASMDAEAYGILCSPILVPLIGTIEVAGQTAIDAANTAVSATGEGITDMANGYDELEKMLGDAFAAIESELGKY